MDNTACNTRSESRHVASAPRFLKFFVLAPLRRENFKTLYFFTKDNALANRILRFQFSHAGRFLNVLAGYSVLNFNPVGFGKWFSDEGSEKGEKVKMRRNINRAS